MTHQTRAEWWREVTDPDEVIPAGCPARAEWPGYAYEEHESKHSSVRGSHSAPHLFIDSRWASAYKVGDVIAECTPDNAPPDGVAIVDAVGDVGQMDGTRLGWACGGDVTWGPSVGERSLPLTVIYVPKVGGSDD